MLSVSHTNGSISVFEVTKNIYLFDQHICSLLCLSKIWFSVWN